jgi:hypothetical protein
MCLNGIRICVCLWENREFVKVDGYDFTPCDGPWNSHLFF